VSRASDIALLSTLVTGFFVLGAAAVWQPGPIPGPDVPMPGWWRQRLVVADLVLKAAARHRAYRSTRMLHGTDGGR
jgi:hypothetical protein